MRVRFPLYAKVMGWFMVNLSLVVALAAGFAAMQFRFGLEQYAPYHGLCKKPVTGHQENCQECVNSAPAGCLSG